MTAVVDMSADYLQTELQRLDLLIHREILRLRALYQLSLDEFRGLYVSDQQVDTLLRNNHQSPEIVDPEDLTRQAAEFHRASLGALDEYSRWSRLRAEFGLNSTDVDVLLLALALEVHPKYETLFAYLNNDVSRKWPTADMVLRLFAEGVEGKMVLRQSLLPHSRLFQNGLLRPVTSTNDRAVSLSSGFVLAAEVYRYLMAFPSAPGRVTDYLSRAEPLPCWERISAPAELRIQLERVPKTISRACACDQCPLIIFVTHYGMGAEEIAEAVCGDLHQRLLFFSIERARTAEEPLRRTLQSVLLEQRLDGAGLFVSEMGSLFNAEGGATSEAHSLIAALVESGGPVFLAFDPHTRWRDLLQGRRKLVFVLEEPNFEERRKIVDGTRPEHGI